LLFGLDTSSWAAPKGVKTLEIGKPAPPFALPGVDGKTCRLRDYDDANVLVIIFSCNHCPTAQAYEDRMIKLHKDYQGRGVQIVLISPNDPEAVRLDELGYSDLGDSLEDMKARAKQRGYPFPYLYDGETQKTSFAYGAVATPHVFVFDKARKLRYTGRIDDGEVKPPKSHDTRNAIEAILAGNPVPVTKTRVFGCSTKWKDKRNSRAVTQKKWEAEEVVLKPIDAEAMTKLLGESQGKYRLVNVWATWCAPCIREIPEFVDLNRMYRRRSKFALMTVCLDDVNKSDHALKILREMYASTTNYIYSGDDKDALAEAIDPEWSGAVPFTVFIDPAGKVLYRHTDTIDPAEIRRLIVNHLGRTYASR